MRIYSAAVEENLRASKLLKDWAGEGFLEQARYEQLKQQTVADVRTTNVFLRLVLFFFTALAVGAAIGLFFAIFVSHGPDSTIGGFLLFFGIGTYVAAEVVVVRARLYRYGIEEALAVCSVACICIGMISAFFSAWRSHPQEWLVLAAGAVLSLWIWQRFGLWYAFLAAMIFVVFLPGYWTSTAAAKHVMIAAIYAAGLTIVIAVRSRHRLDFMDGEYSLVEALLWLGIYLAINLKIWSFDPRSHWLGGGIDIYSGFSKPFYWTTWVLIWVLPAVVLVRGLRNKDRFVIAVGGISAVLTFVTNKPYLGWQRHTWDPMLLGVLLIGVALYVRRWLAASPSGVRRGFTAASLSGKDKRWMNIASPALGLVTPQAVAPQHSDDFHFDGGASGGGGASGDF